MKESTWERLTKVGAKIDCSNCEVVRKLKKKIEKQEKEIKVLKKRAHISGLSIVY